MPPSLTSTSTPSKKIKGSSCSAGKEEEEGMGNRNNEGKERETSLIYDGLYYTYATSRQEFCLLLLAKLHSTFSF